MDRFKFVSCIIGVIFLVVNYICLMAWYYNEIIGGNLILLLDFLLKAGLILLCERISVVAEMEALLKNHSNEEKVKNVKKLFFVIPIVLIAVSVSILLVTTFTEYRAYFWLIALFNTCSIFLMYAECFIDMLQKFLVADEEDVKTRNENKCEEEIITAENETKDQSEEI